MYKIGEKLIDKLCADLKDILELEIKAGNKVVETGNGWPKEESIFIMLGKPFKVEPSSEKALIIPECVEFNNTNDPHYWKAEYYCKAHGHIIACRFE
jgi:hypothetical protein